MSQTTARTALAIGFGSGFAGAVLAVLLTRPAVEAGDGSAEGRSAEPRPTETAPSAPFEPDAELAMQIAQLSERVAGLEARLAESQRKPAEGYVTRTELEEWLAELELPEGPLELAGLTTQNDEAFKQGVLDAVRTVEQERASKKLEASRQSRIERVDRDVASAGKLLDLTPSQEDNLRNALLASYEREEQVLALWQEGASDEVLGAVKQENSELLQTDLGAFLTEEQVGMYNALAAGGGK
ncbi:MAG: hypothetical protein ACYTFV_07390 [Planctomycetota bacterium]|jgi:hypothetical protein